MIMTEMLLSRHSVGITYRRVIMNTISENNYICILGFMVTELELKGNELLIYAIIHGFSQSESQYYSGSLKYLCEWTRASKQTVINCLKSLIEKDLIIKKEEIQNGVKFCYYQSKNLTRGSQKTELGWSKNLTEGGQKIRPNNIVDNIEYTYSLNNNKDLFTTFCGDNTDLLNALKAFVEMRKKIKKPMTDYGKELLLKKLKTFPESDWLGIIEQSITSSWTGLYPLKEKKGYVDPDDPSDLDTF